MVEDFVILVDEHDHELGIMEKMEAHVKGELHRAFSIFIFNADNELLIHKRAASKYHSGGLWTNTCCSHPKPGESTEDAATRRLQEEMGISGEMAVKFSFVYRAQLDKGMIEHEFDHVLIGRSDEIPKMNPSEVSDYKYVSLDELLADIKSNPHDYTEWFKICLDQNLHKIIVAL